MWVCVSSECSFLVQRASHHLTDIQFIDFTASPQDTGKEREKKTDSLQRKTNSCLKETTGQVCMHFKTVCELRVNVITSKTNCILPTVTLIKNPYIKQCTADALSTIEETSTQFSFIQHLCYLNCKEQLETLQQTSSLKHFGLRHKLCLSQ